MATRGGTVRTAVLGGGVAGVMVAQELCRAGSEVTVFERSERLGGLQHSVERAGRVFDIGTFLFGYGHELFQSFPMLRDIFVPIDHRAQSITPSGRADRYPCSFSGYAADNGWSSLARSGVETLYSRLRYRSRDTIPNYARYYMGDTFYRQSGLQHYIERLYALSDTDIGIEFAEQRLNSIKKYTPTALAKRAASAGARRLRGEPADPVLVRPPEGFGRVYEVIEQVLVDQGVDVRRGASVDGIRRSGDVFHLQTDRGEECFDVVVSTIPIPIALRLIGEDPGDGFDHVHLLSLFYTGISRHDAWLQCNFSGRGNWKKLTVFSKCYGQVEGQDYFTAELTTRDTSAEAIEEARQEFERHAAELGLFEGPIECVGHLVTPRAYPVFRKGAGGSVERDRRRLAEAGLSFVGRQGNFEYSPSALVAHKAAALGRELNARAAA